MKQDGETRIFSKLQVHAEKRRQMHTEQNRETWILFHVSLLLYVYSEETCRNIHVSPRIVFALTPTI